MAEMMMMIKNCCRQAKEILFVKQDEQEGERPDSDCEKVGEEAGIQTKPPGTDRFK